MESDYLAGATNALYYLGLSFQPYLGQMGELSIDCGREMYDPSALASGKTLYVDVWYPYTPAAPYLNALLFRLFGIRLEGAVLGGRARVPGPRNSSLFHRFAFRIEVRCFGHGDGNVDSGVSACIILFSTRL
jgi:hypothetical protein